MTNEQLKEKSTTTLQYYKIKAHINELIFEYILSGVDAIEAENILKKEHPDWFEMLDHLEQLKA